MKMFQQFFSFVLLMSGFQRFQALSSPSADLYVEVHPGWKTYLTCPLEAENIEWEGPEGCESHFSSHKTQVLHDVDLHCAGVYTCSDAGDPGQTARLHVLVPGEGSLMVRCQTDSYTNSHLNCSIHEDFLCPCEVTANAYRNGTVSPSITKHFTSEEVHDMHFPVSIAQVFCAYGEHMEGIHLSVKVTTEKEYWHINTTIIMADIVVPGPPENGEVTCNQISWHFPSNWSDSSTFFPLLFRLDLKMRDDRRVRRLLEGQTNYEIKDVEEFQVQCRDLFSDTSPWSAWSPNFRREC